MKSLAIIALAFAAACGSSSPLVAAPVDVTNVRAAASEYSGPAPTDEVARLRVPVDGTEPSRGPADAKVTIVIFSDFECPFCARVRPTLDRVMSTYGQDVRLVWRNTPLPFHDRAMPAAALAMEAFNQRGNEGFWAAHDLIFLNQRALTDEDLRRYAGQLGLNEQGVTAALAGAHDAAIQADIQFAGTIGLRGTPGFIINGEKLMGAQPFEAFQPVIDRAIAAADFVAANGAARADVYAALMQHASTGPVADAVAPGAPAARPGRPDPAAVYNVPITSPIPARGVANALVTIVVFSDFQCPFCSRLEPTFDDLLQRYPNDLRVVWMNHPLPFHQNAMPAAQAALEAFDQGGDTHFWAYHEKLFANQRALERPDLERYAREVGLDMTMFNASLDNNEHRQTINDQAALATRLGARGTPASFVNGRYLAGAVPATDFVAVIDQELTRARAAVASGTPRANIYDVMVAGGLTAPAPTIPSAAAPAPPRPDADRDYGIAVPANAPARGSSSPQIVIQTFSDFQCPFCSRVLPAVEQVMQQYGNQVRFVWRNYPLPFHQDAALAAEAAMEVHAQGGDARFWAYHDLLFANQRALDRPNLETYAQQVGGINMARFRAALDNRTHRAAVDADIAAVANSGARIGTPSFFINGRLVQGAQPFEAFRTAIDRELAR